MRELDIHKTKVDRILDYKEDIYQLSKNIIQEKVKIKALSEELENPLNLFRWRSIGSADYDTYELMNKIQNFQKRLILKTEELVAKDLQIKSREDEILKTKKLIEERPGIEEAKKLSFVQQRVKKKTRTIKVLIWVSIL